MNYELLVNCLIALITLILGGVTIKKIFFKNQVTKIKQKDISAGGDVAGRDINR